MEFKEIIYEKDRGIARVIINRPQRYNAFTASNTILKRSVPT